ncbi:MAG: alkaline phosphatase PhoX [Crocinitomicaceae bacterium]
MKRILFSVSALIAGVTANAQLGFNPQIDFTVETETVIVPASPIKKQVLFIGGVDEVQTTDTYGNPGGSFPAKQWHDFIGFTEDTDSDDLGWISVNHEMVTANDNIGDGGGMTVFKVRRDAATDTLIIVEQVLTDGREGLFFNVDFANTVGETGMNCGGIQSAADGRIWTAEEWWRNNNVHIYDDGEGVRDTAEFTINGTGMPAFDGESISKYQNFNYMVEIDPREAVAIRKQYNWGRQPFEGGVVMPDNKTVYLGADATPGILTKFVADEAGDFTSGVTYFYKEDAPTKWVEIDNEDLATMLDFTSVAIENGATMFNRLEWVAYDEIGEHVYMTETGRDNPASRWNDEMEDGGMIASHHYARANNQFTTPDDPVYADYYGRVLKLDVDTEEISVYLEGGPNFGSDVVEADYPSTHLSNPDGLGFITIGDVSYMLICEDLNGTSNGRMPAGYDNRTCELFMLDMRIENPSLDDLIRIATVPIGAEITGVRATPDGKTILFNSQHPNAANPFPYNNSCTIALTGFTEGFAGIPTIDESIEELKLYPNPATQIVYMNKTTDVALYNANGQLIQVFNNIDKLNISSFPAGTYYIQTAEKETKTLIIQ